MENMGEFMRKGGLVLALLSLLGCDDGRVHIKENELYTYLQQVENVESSLDDDMKEPFRNAAYLQITDATGNLTCLIDANFCNEHQQREIRKRLDGRTAIEIIDSTKNMLIMLDENKKRREKEEIKEKEEQEAKEDEYNWSESIVREVDFKNVLVSQLNKYYSELSFDVNNNSDINISNLKLAVVFFENGKVIPLGCESFYINIHGGVNSRETKNLSSLILDYELGKVIDKINNSGGFLNYQFKIWEMRGLDENNKEFNFKYKGHQPISGFSLQSCAKILQS